MKQTYLAPSSGFLGLPTSEAGPAADASVVVVPFGLEASVCYEGGTGKGPRAILDASAEVELFDEELWCEPHKSYSLATLKPAPIKDKLVAALTQLEKTIEPLLAAGKFPLTLGGEHSLTAGAIRPFANRFKKLTILHFDAHADLRDGFEGERYSHAAAMRRCLDFPNVRLVSVGIRNISAEEVPFLEANKKRITIFWAKDRKKWKIADIVKAVGNGPVYLSFDLDAFDSSLMAATGTPEPGGLFWDETMDILRGVIAAHPLVGADVVELAPQKGFHACSFLAAKLCAKILAYNFALRRKGKRKD